MNKFSFAIGFTGSLLMLPKYAICDTGKNSVDNKNKPTHIILLMTDQQRFDAMGCAGNNTILTPNIDGLAEDGNLFTSAYSSTPSSTPARAGLLTGMSPCNHGMLGYGESAERYEYETPRMLSDLGYYTIGIGKMHWFPQNNKRGFHNVLFDESGRVESENFISDYRKWFNTKASGLNPDSTGIGWNSHQAGNYKLPEELHPTVWTADMAVETIAGYQSDKPLYLKVSFARPHSPYDPPQRIVDMYDNMPEPLKPARGEWEPEKWKSYQDPMAKLDAFIGNFSDEYIANSRKYYNAAVTHVDEQLGRVITELKNKGIYDDALIFFVSDHGDMLGDHYLWRKTYAYEGSAAIPFIVKLPKDMDRVVKAGQEIDYPVELRDILPTMLDINDCEQPEKMDGISLLTLFTEKKPEWREFIDLEHSSIYFKDNYWCALTDGKIKYVWFFFTGEEQLFDMQTDPSENINLAQSKKYSSKLEKIRKAMVDHLKIRGEEWVKDDKLVIREHSVVYGDNFPEKKGKAEFVK